MDAPYIAVIAGVMLITPPSHCNLLPDPVLTRRKLVTSMTNEDDDDDDSCDGLAQAHMSLQMGSGRHVTKSTHPKST